MAATFGTMVRHGMAKGAPAGWGSLTACSDMAGDVGKEAALSGRLGRRTVGGKY